MCKQHERVIKGLNNEELSKLNRYLGNHDEVTSLVSIYDTSDNPSVLNELRILLKELE